MHEYLFHRSNLCPTPDTPPEFVADDVFFHQWIKRQHPFNEIESGDRLWWVDKQSREIRWELRTVEVVKQPFSSPMEALGFLRRAYGLLPDELDQYFAAAPPSGWLLAFAVDVMQPVTGVNLPAGEHLARNGLRTLTPELRAQLEEAGLPTSAAEPIAQPVAVMNADAISSIFVPNPTRHIPSAIKATVWENSGGVCKECGRQVDRGEIHFDHYIPFSRGGHSTVDNLRVLCAPCNLSKGARMPPRAEIRTFDEPIADLAAVLGRNQPRSIGDLVALLGEAVESDEVDEVDAARVAALTLYRDVEFDDASLDRCIDAIDGAAATEDLVALLRLHDSEDRTAGLTSLLTSDDDAVRLEAGVELCAEDQLDPDVALPILVEAASSTDRHLADHAVYIAAGLPGTTNPDLPEIESLLESPVMEWRCRTALALAESMYDKRSEGQTIDGDRFFGLCDVALAAPDRATSHEAAMLLAYFWSDASDRETARPWVEQYLDFAGRSDDDDLLADIADLRRSLDSSQ